MITAIQIGLLIAAAAGLVVLVTMLRVNDDEARRNRMAAKQAGTERFWKELPPLGPWEQPTAYEVDEYHRLGSERIRRAMEEET